MRKVDLNSYLPQVIGDAKEIIEMNRVEDIELTDIWKEADRNFWNRWILTSDERGLERYESLLQLEPEGSIDQRRRTAWYEWNKYIIYTDRSVRALLDGLLGADGYAFDIQHEEYTITLSVVLMRSNVSINYVYDQMRYIIPANIGMKIKITSLLDLILETKYDSFYYRYWMCGQHLCGTLPWYVNRGVLIDAALNVLTGLGIRHNRIPLADFRKRLGEELIYPSVNRGPLDEWIVDSASAFDMSGSYVLYSGGY